MSTIDRKDVIEKFKDWYLETEHIDDEDKYKDTINLTYLSNLNKDDLISFFVEFVRKGGKIQSAMPMKIHVLEDSLKINYDDFREFILEPFSDNFSLKNWLSKINNFKEFGVGIATIYLCRVDKNKYPVMNQKTMDGLKVLGFKVNKGPSIKEYSKVKEYQKELIKENEFIDNYYKADALMHFAVAEYPSLRNADSHQPNIKEKNNHNPNLPLNTILYGPPGTGKTFNTVRMAAEIVKGKDNVKDHEDAKIIFNDNLGDQIEFITFHQNYSYEDFIQGLRPDVEDSGGLSFKKVDGVFKRIADRALENLELNSTNKLPFETVFRLYFKDLKAGIVSKITVKMKRVSYEITEFTENRIPFTKNSGGTAHYLRVSRLKKMYINESVGEQKGLVEYYEPLLNEFLELDKKTRANAGNAKKNYVIIIDEINRANISRVFGELITLIEKDKRSHGDIPMQATLPSGDTFMVPSNLYIIGTMNTADKSIALLDIALRRRFTFVGMYPNSDLVQPSVKNQFELLNKKIIELGKGRDFQIGHSYFMGKEFNLVSTMNNKVIPLLMEYFMNAEETVIKLLEDSGFSFKKEASGKVYWPLEIESVKEEDGN